MNFKSLVLASVFLIAPLAPVASQNLDISRINATVPYGEGGGSDTLVRAISPYLSKALKNKPTILVRNEPGGGGIPAANRFIRKAKSDGSNILAMSSSLFVAYVLGAKQIDFKLDQFVPVFVAPMAPIIYVSPSTGATGPGDVKGLKNTKLVKGGGRQGSADALLIMQFDLLGINIQPVWGLGRGAGRIGFERGEFNVDHQTSAAYVRNVKPLVDSGKAIPFMTTGIISPDSEIIRDPNFPDIPTFMELYEKIHGKTLSGPAYRAYFSLMSAAITTGKAIVLPANAPKNVVKAYTAAFAKVVVDPAFRKATKRSLGGYKLYTGEEAKALWGAFESLDKDAHTWLANWFDTKLRYKLAPR